jgi:uncharacterized membrane protein (DUF485 family)
MRPPQTLDIHSESFLASLLKRQLKLSVSCASVFALMLFCLPLANYFLPDLMAQRIGGFTLSWLILGVACFPCVWIIAWVFIKRSISLERNEVAEAQRTAPAANPPANAL